MPPLCTVCRHPEISALDDGLLRGVPLRKLAQSVMPLTSATALHRHRKHLATHLFKAQAPEMVSEATNSLLARVESLIPTLEKIAVGATEKGEWTTALSATREAQRCLELLSRLRGKLQQPGAHQRDLETTPQPRDAFEIERAIAKHVSEATNGFDVATIARLKALAGVTVVPADERCPQTLDSEGGV